MVSLMLNRFIEDSKSFHMGEFQLSSGIKSDWYFDARRLLLTPEPASWVGHYINNVAHTHNVSFVGGPVLGAVPMVSAAVINSINRHKKLNGFLVRPETKPYGRELRIEGLLNDGCDVIIVDDVCTTGSSLYNTIYEVESIDCKVKAVVVLLDRSNEIDVVNRFDIDCIKDSYDFISILDMEFINDLKNNHK